MSFSKGILKLTLQIYSSSNSFVIFISNEILHSLGHGVGMDIHELPFLGINSEVILKSNIVITSEPGIYIPGKFGVRIEDTVLVGKSVGIPLTKSKKDYIII